MTRREWATTLASICSPSWPEQAIEALVDMLPLLAEWPDQCFTLSTMKDIAGSKRRQAIPSYDEICTIFRQIWRDDMHPVIRGGGSLTIAQIVEEKRPPTQAERDHVTAVTQSFIAEHGGKRQKAEAVKPLHLTKLQLAMSAPPEVLKTRPDLRQALADYEAANGTH